VSNKYVQLILKELADEPDGVGFRGIISSERSWPVEFVHKAGLTYSDKPIQYQKSFIYTRPLNHLNPVRLDIARQIVADTAVPPELDATKSAILDLFPQA
jgi:hypothetical protein